MYTCMYDILPNYNQIIDECIYIIFQTYYWILKISVQHTHTALFTEMKAE